jgi:hypothetical protein
MAAQSPAQLQHRLGEQLQALSQVSEALMFRLLDLEERLGAVEQQLGSLHARDDQAAPALDTGEILAVTEERLARLEDLLSGRRQPLGSAAGPHGAIKAVGSPALREAAFDPFPEEEEQAFMDELIA